MRLSTVDNPEQLIKALTGGRGPREPIKAADPLAQIMELRARWNAVQTTEDFKPGDLCAEKDIFGSTIPGVGTLLYIYWCDIDHSNPMHQGYLDKWGSDNDFEPTDDCFIGLIIPGDSGLFMMRPYTKARLRRLTPEETRLDDEMKELN